MGAFFHCRQLPREENVQKHEFIVSNNTRRERERERKRKQREKKVGLSLSLTHGIKRTNKTKYYKKRLPFASIEDEEEKN